MDAASIIASGNNTTTTTKAKESGFSAMTSEDFTKLIFEELTNQDPLAPNDTNALIQQIANIRNIQSDLDLSTNLGSLVDQQSFAAATSVIGKFVSGISDESGRVSGIVKSVVRTTEGTVVSLKNGEIISFDKVDAIREPDAAPTTAAATSAATAPQAATQSKNETQSTPVAAAQAFARALAGSAM